MSNVKSKTVESSFAPWVTLALTTFNQSEYVEAAINSALSQDYSPLEIIISDDASTDGTFELIKRAVSSYRGPHVIRLCRNDRNLGVNQHIHKVIELACADLVVLAAGDDISFGNRVSRIVESYKAHLTDTFCFSSQAITIDERGRMIGHVAPCPAGDQLTAVDIARDGVGVLGATLAVRKDLIRSFDDHASSLPGIEDMVLPFRAALLGKIHIDSDSLVMYRVHGRSFSGAGTAKANDGAQFRNGLRKWVNAVVNTLRQQMVDLLTARSSGLVSPLQYSELESLLKTRLESTSLQLALLNDEPGSVKALFSRGRFSKEKLVEISKSLLMYKYSSVWFHYIRMRQVLFRRGLSHYEVGRE